MKRRTPLVVGDLEGGEFIRVHAGVFRATNFVMHGDRLGILLRDDLSETSDRVWLAQSTKLLEVIVPPKPKAPVGGETVDPVGGDA